LVNRGLVEHPEPRRNPRDCAELPLVRLCLLGARGWTRSRPPGESPSPCPSLPSTRYDSAGRRKSSVETEPLGGSWGLHPLVGCGDADSTPGRGADAVVKSERGLRGSSCARARPPRAWVAGERDAPTVASQAAGDHLSR